MLLRITVAIALLGQSAAADKTFSKGTGETWDCATDPVITIKTSKGTYGFHGDCKRITITGGKNVVSIGNVGKLVVGGSENLVDTETVDSIVVNGTKNNVTWKHAGSGDKPKITAGSKTNHVTQAK